MIGKKFNIAKEKHSFLWGFPLTLVIVLLGATLFRNNAEANLNQEVGTPIPTPSPALISTATLIPFPTVTFIYPESDSQGEFQSAQREPGLPALSKGSEPLTLARFANWWPFLVVLFIWLILGGWYFLLQRYGDEDVE